MSEPDGKLKILPEELFRPVQSDLDFSLDRVTHAKSDEVSPFLETVLRGQVQAPFGLPKTANKGEIEVALDKNVEGIESAFADCVIHNAGKLLSCKQRPGCRSAPAKD
jgi:hypothetical protein